MSIVVAAAAAAAVVARGEEVCIVSSPSPRLGAGGLCQHLIIHWCNFQLQNLHKRAFSNSTIRLFKNFKTAADSIRKYLLINRLFLFCRPCSSPEQSTMVQMNGRERYYQCLRLSTKSKVLFWESDQEFAFCWNEFPSDRGNSFSGFNSQLSRTKNQWHHMAKDGIGLRLKIPQIQWLFICLPPTLSSVSRNNDSSPQTQP